MAGNWRDVTTDNSWRDVHDVRLPEPARRNAIVAGLSSGTDDLQGLGYSAGAALADTVGATRVRDWLNRQADENQYESKINGRPDLDRIEDQSVGSFPSYLTYQIAKQIPNIAGTVAASVVVPEAAIPAAMSRGLAYLPKWAGGGALGAAETFGARKAALEAGRGLASDVMGGAAMNYAQGVGSLYQESVDGGNPNAGFDALLGGVPYGLSETAPEAMLLGRIKRGTGFSGGMPVRMLKSGVTQAGTGATSELLQNEMEMSYNGNVSPEDAASRRLNSGVAGGLVEGVLGGIGGMRGHSKARTIESGGTVDVTAPEATNYPLAIQGERGLARVETPVYEQEMPPDVRFGSAHPLLSGPQGTVLYGTADGVVGSKQALSGQQYNMFAEEGAPPEGFDPSLIGPQLGAVRAVPTDFGASGQSVEQMRDPTLGRPMPQQSTAVDDGRSMDMFHANPTSMAPTAFNPMTEPGNPNQFQYNAADPTAQQRPAAATRGAVASNIRAQLVQRVGAADGFATKISMELADRLGNSNAVATYLHGEVQKQDKEMERLNRKVDQGSDQLSPEEYQVKRDAIEKRQLTLMAALDLMQHHLRQSVSPMVDEGLGKAQPGVSTGVEQGNDTEQRMRKQNAARESANTAAATAVVDQQAQLRQQGESQQARLAIIRDTLGEKTRSQPVARVREALRKAGYTNLDLSQAEQEEVNRITQKRSDVRAATVIPPGLAAARGKLTSRESLNTETAAKEETAAAPVQEKPVVPVPTKPASPVVSAKPEAPAGESSKPAATTDKPKKQKAPAVAAPVAEEKADKPAPVAATAPDVATKPSQPTPVEMTAEERKRLSKMQDMVAKYEKLLACLRS